MNKKNLYRELIKRLDNIISQENKKPLKTLAGFIVGEIIVDYDNVGFRELYESDDNIVKLSANAESLEWENGDPEELWSEVKRYLAKLKEEHTCE